MNSIQDIWSNVMDVLSTQLTPTSINTWFNDCEPVALDSGKLVLRTSTSFKRDIINQRFAEQIRSVLSDLFSCDYDLLILTEDEIYEAEERSDNNPLPEMEDYTFDNFIVGNSNRMAHAAARHVAEDPGSKAYNPLFIYGDSGLGKTHLLCAIGYDIFKRSPETKIAYIKGDEFTNQMVNSIREGTAEEFRQKYRNMELFLVDDIQFISGKPQTQEEFFHTFNNIYEAGHQIVITSDRPPKDMLTLDDRLRTRFESSLIVDMQMPDLETRMAIVTKKAGLLGMTLNDDIVQYIAEKITSNVRQIEGVVKRLTAYRELKDEEIDIQTVDRALEDVIQSGDYVPTPDDIIRAVADYYQISIEDIKSQKRNADIVSARHVAIYLTRTLNNISLEKIGSWFNRDHATVLASIQKIEKMVKADSKTASTIRDITSNINSRS